MGHAERGSLARADGLQEGEVGGVADAGGAAPPAAVGGGTADLVQEPMEGGAVLDGGERVQIVLVGALRDLGPAVEVGDPLPEGAPGEGSAGLVLEWTEDLEVGRLGDGGLEAQDAGPGVHLGGGAVHPVLDPGALGAVLEAGGGFRR